MPIWTIKGENGKAIDATARTFEDLRISQPILTFESLAADTFQCTQDDDGNVPKPEPGQLVEILHNGTRAFLGTVRPLPLTYNRGQRLSWTAVGPLWFMDQVQVTSDITDQTDTDQERTQIAFKSGNLKTHLTNLITRFATVYGTPAPLAVGTISDVFDFPQITLSNQTYLSALSELCRPFPDCITHLDYSTTPPQLHITRRDDAAVLSLAQNGMAPLLDYNLKPRTELQLEEVKINFSQRGDEGLSEFKTQTAGTASNVTKRQVVTISGPELDTFLPAEGFDRVIVRQPATLTEAYPYVDSATNYYLDRWGDNPLNGGDKTINTSTLFSAASSSTNFGINATTTVFHAPRLQLGDLVSFANSATLNSHTLLIFGDAGNSEPPQWVIDQLGLIPGEWTGGIHQSYPFDGSLSQDQVNDLFAIAGDYNRTDTAPSPDVKHGGKIISGGVTFPNGINNPPYEHRPVIRAWMCPNANLPTVPTDGGSWRRVSSSNRTQLDLKEAHPDLLATPDLIVGSLVQITGFGIINAVLVSAAEVVNADDLRITFRNDDLYTLPDFGPRNYTVQVPAQIFRSADWDYLTPPADLASNLKAAQDWLPYSGSVNLGYVADPLPTSLLGRTLNLTDGPTALANAKALIQGLRLECGTGKAELRIGAPTRNDFPTLASRLRRTPQDNIFYI